MIRFSRHRKLKNALLAATKMDKNRMITGHHLKRGEEIPADTHDVDEWIVIDNGRCHITNRQYEYELEAGPHIFTVHIPKGEEHAFVALSDLVYFVVKEIKK